MQAHANVVVILALCLATVCRVPRAAKKAAASSTSLCSRPFVTNYGVTKTGRLTYLKADVTLKVADPEGEAALKYHTPALRNALVLLFSRQEDAAVSSSDGREQIRQEALTELARHHAGGRVASRSSKTWCSATSWCSTDV